MHSQYIMHTFILQISHWLEFPFNRHGIFFTFWSSNVLNSKSQTFLQSDDPLPLARAVSHILAFLSLGILAVCFHFRFLHWVAHSESLSVLLFVVSPQPVHNHSSVSDRNIIHDTNEKTIFVSAVENILYSIVELLALIVFLYDKTKLIHLIKK